MFDRKTFTSVAVMGAMGKLIETSVVPALDPATSPRPGRVGAWIVVFIAAVAISVYWERLAKAGDEVTDAIEDATNVE